MPSFTIRPGGTPGTCGDFSFLPQRTASFARRHTEMNGTLSQNPPAPTMLAGCIQISRLLCKEEKPTLHDFDISKIKHGKQKIRHSTTDFQLTIIAKTLKQKAKAHLSEPLSSPRSHREFPKIDIRARFPRAKSPAQGHTSDNLYQTSFCKFFGTPPSHNAPHHAKPARFL